MQVIDILIAAKAKIAKPENWGKGNYVSRAADGTTQYCAIGAVVAASDELGCDDKLLVAAEGMLRLGMGGDGKLVRYNDADERKHEEILAVYDRAIELAKAE